MHRSVNWWQIQNTVTFEIEWPTPPNDIKADLVYFQEALGDIVFVDLPEDGRTYEKDGKDQRASITFIFL